MPKQFGHPEKSRRLKTFAPVNFFVAARHSGWFLHERESMLARTIVEAVLNMRT